MLPVHLFATVRAVKTKPQTLRALQAQRQPSHQPKQQYSAGVSPASRTCRVFALSELALSFLVKLNASVRLRMKNRNPSIKARSLVGYVAVECFCFAPEASSRWLCCSFGAQRLRRRAQPIALAAPGRGCCRPLR